MDVAKEQKWKAGGASAAVVLILLLVGARLASGPEPTFVAPPGDADPDVPLEAGVEMSIDDATARFPVPIYRPNASESSDSNLTSVWVRTDVDPEAYLEYASGLVVIERPSKGLRSTADYASAQIRDGVPGSVVNVAGVDAFLVPQSQSGAGSIRLVLGESVVTAIGAEGDFSESELLAIGKSIVETAPFVNTEA